MTARLEAPQLRYRDSFIAAAWEYIREGLAPQWKPDKLNEDFAAYIEVLRQAELAPLAGRVPTTFYWLVSGEHFIGEVELRHRLTAELERFGGHMGYRIRPSQRRKGYGRLICRLGIEKACQLGIHDLLITCDEDNIASRRIIEANGGILQKRIEGQPARTRRYWIYG